MKYSNKQYLQDLTRNQQLDIMGVDFFDDKKLDVIEVNYGYILPSKFADKNADTWFVGGVVDEKLNYIKESGQYACGEKNRVVGKYDFDANDVNYIDEEVVFMNRYISQWGHFLLDVIGRLWYVLNNKDYKIVCDIGIHGSNYIKGNFLEILKLLGINEDRIIYNNEITKYKKIIIPQTSIEIANFYTKEYKQIIDKVIDNALKGYDLNKGRQIYCSRRKFNDRRTVEFGEELIEKIYKDNGYEIVYMEDLDAIEQIRLLNECKDVVCISGTLVHNAMFIRNENCNFTILNKTYKINPNIYLTNLLSSCNFRFIDIYLSPLPISIGKGPFMIYISDEFKQYCKDNGMVINVENKISFIEKIKYYAYYFMKYRKKLLKNEEVSDSGFEKYNVSNSDIREHYLKQLKLINK